MDHKNNYTLWEEQLKKDPLSYKNLTVKIIVPTVRPFISVVNGKIESKLPIKLFTELFPSRTM